MSVSTITLGGNTVSVVSMPSLLGLASVEFSFTDAVAIVSSPFTGQTQAQQWPGADMWSGTATLPPLTQDQADLWISFLMEVRGQANAFFFGDPLKRSPRGNFSGTPLIDGTTPVAVGGQTLYTKGWTPSRTNLFLPGDYIQLGYRLHRVLDPVNSDSSGKASFNIWPSLREVPTDGQVIIYNNPVGLFRLASNKRTWSSDYSRISKLSFQFMEYR